MPKLPRDLSGAQLIHALQKLGYAPTRQSGSHVRLTCVQTQTQTQAQAQGQAQEHHLTVPLHDPLRIGTLAAILADVSQAQALPREALLRKLFG